MCELFYASPDYAITANSKLCIITAGARQREGESRLSLVQRNVDIFKGIVPKLVKHSPGTLIMVVSNPGELIIVPFSVDVLTYATWKLSGLPKENVFGSGTNLDSARLAVWSGVNIAGVSLSVVSKNIGSREGAESWQTEIHKKVVDSAYEIIKLKGYTSWAIGLSVAKIVHGIMGNTRNVFALSVNVNGLHGITDDVYLSLPCVVGTNGVTHVVKQNLNPEEIDKLHKSWKTLSEVQHNIKW
ncbi:unnamed protein product [Heligmosomoides polygyrus]|uniref:Ldh_1_C domain-containing protein n=1 Tax=Heligmosomoides polygyrus TaxID=6339 RepID=A0A183FXA7_HELPZ|nr:unnamed protein product [Heligmosomoides polygyrus]